MTNEAPGCDVRGIPDGLVGARDAQACFVGARILPVVLRHLAEGRAAPVASVAAALDLSVSSTNRVLHSVCPAVERDDQGGITGLGLTLNPTPHELRIEGGGQKLYAWCALDALVLPTTIGLRATVHSPCKATGRTIRARTDRDGVKTIDPPEAVATFVPQVQSENVRESRCAHQNLFVSPREAESGVSRQPGVLILPVRQAFRYMRNVHTAISSSCGS